MFDHFAVSVMVCPALLALTARWLARAIGTAGLRASHARLGLSMAAPGRPDLRGAGAVPRRVASLLAPRARSPGPPSGRRGRRLCRRDRRGSGRPERPALCGRILH